MSALYTSTEALEFKTTGCLNSALVTFFGITEMYVISLVDKT